MNSLARALNIRHLYRYYFLIWVVLCLLEISKSYALNQPDFVDFISLIHWPIAPFFSFWLLGLAVFNLFQPSSKFDRTKFIVTHLAIAILFAVLHQILSPLVEVLLISMTSDINPPIVFNLWSSTSFLKLAFGTIVYGLFLWVLISLAYYRQYRLQYERMTGLERQLDSSQLQQMKTQLNPHFLFNALNTIAMVVRQERKDEAIGMLGNLGGMLRRNLTKETSQFVKLEEELDFLKQYLSIESVRYQDRLTIKWDIDESLLNHLVPGLILQPIVENAFKHGISKNLGESELKISVQKRENFIELEIYNSGSQLPLNWEFQKNKGIGLANTSSRLMKLYDQEVKLLILEKDEGISVILRLPI